MILGIDTKHQSSLQPHKPKKSYQTYIYLTGGYDLLPLIFYKKKRNRKCDKICRIPANFSKIINGKKSHCSSIGTTEWIRTTDPHHVKVVL